MLASSPSFSLFNRKSCLESSSYITIHNRMSNTKHTSASNKRGLRIQGISLVNKCSVTVGSKARQAVEIEIKAVFIAKRTENCFSSTT